MSFFRFSISFTLLPLFLFFSLFPSFVFAKEDIIQFEYVEQDLFPSWRGSESAPSQMEEIIHRMSPQDKEHLSKLQQELVQKQQDFEFAEREYKQKKDILYTNHQDQIELRGEAERAEYTYKECVVEKGASQCEDEKEDLVEIFEDRDPNDTEMEQYEQSLNHYETQKNNLQEAEKNYQEFLGQWHNQNMLPKGVIGSNCDGNFLLDYLPILVNIMLKLVAPCVMAMIIFSGSKFIYGGDDDSVLEEAKNWFMYAVIGIILIILSYSIMKATYFIFSTTEEQYEYQKYICKEYDTITEYPIIIDN